jgi:ketosteroid isomerase-like protein
MSEENVELVNRGWEAWLRGDLDGLAELWDSEVEFDVTHFRDWPEPAYFGIDGVKRFFTQWLEVWDDYEVGVDETLATPDGRVISLAWQRGKGRQSGLEMDVEWAVIFTLRDGKITRIDNYDNRETALEAAGLRE